jgi:hypothetical protein
LLSDVNTWSGTTNTFSNSIIVPNQTAGNSSTNAANTSFVSTAITNLKAAVNTWSGTTNTFSNSIIVPNQTAGNSSTNAANTSFVTTAINTLKAGTTWTGTQNFTGATITAPTKTVGTNTTDVATCAFVLANAGSGGLLASTNVWTGASNTFNTQIITPSISNGNSDLTLGTTGTIFVGNGKSSGFIAMGGGCLTIANGSLSCNGPEILLNNTTSSQIYANSATAPFTLRSDNTMNCIGSGLSKFGSWNGGQVELGTQSFSNIVIGAGGTAGNLRTTTIKGTLIATGSGGPDTTLWGLISSEFKTTSLNYQIPTGINRDYTLIMITSAALNITLPAVKLDQVLHIRNRGPVTLSIKIPAGVTLYPVGLAGQTTSWSLVSNASLNIISDGTANWYGF